MPNEAHELSSKKQKPHQHQHGTDCPMCFIYSILSILVFLFVGLIIAKIDYERNREQSNISAMTSPTVHEKFRFNHTQELQKYANRLKSKKASNIEPSINVLQHARVESSNYTSTKYAYVTLVHGIDDSFSYRGFLYNCILMKKSLERQGSTQDFIALVGFTNGIKPDNKIIMDDMQLLKNYGIKTFVLPRFLHGQTQQKVSFAEMALLKITPWSFTQYKAIQYLDGDVLPFANMDCLFQLQRNSFNTGNASPLNSGWYLAIPNITDYESLKTKALHRLTHKWDEFHGWGVPVPTGEASLKFRGNGRSVMAWNFNGASLDQGLLTNHFVLHHGRAQLFDTEDALLIDANHQVHETSLAIVLKDCAGTVPTDMFYHYTGHSKPWLSPKQMNSKRANKKMKAQSKGIQYWKDLLDHLQLPLNSTTVYEVPLRSPLGYFAPNK